MPIPTFRENCSTFNASGYNVTNEEPGMLNKLLGRRCFKKAAGIMSGGEVLFSVLLPRCQEVVAVDHSYTSLTAAYLKAILLDQLGAKELQRLLFESTYDQCFPYLKTAATSLPPELTTHVKLDSNGGSSRTFSYDMASLRREWFYFPEAALERARRRLGNVTVIHGDLSDLSSVGQFSLLYVSNVTEHQNRDKRMPTFTDFAKLVAKNGLLLATSTSYGIVNRDGWELVKSLRGVRTSWAHNLYRKLD